jgi:hypothetical protein
MVALGRVPIAPAGVEAATDEALLDADERAILLAVVERMVDTGEPSAPSPQEVRAVERIEALLSISDPELPRALRIALSLVDLWPALVELRFRRFRSLTDEEKDRSLEGWRRSRLELRRRIFYGLRAVALYGYWGAEATWRLVGYPGPWIGRRS